MNFLLRKLEIVPALLIFKQSENSRSRRNQNFKERQYLGDRAAQTSMVCKKQSW